MFFKKNLFLIFLLSNIFGSELKDEFHLKYIEEDLISIGEFYNNDKQLIIYIDYFTTFPKYQRVRRDNYIGYQNNCIESRIYFNEKQFNVYEVYYDRERCNGQIKMIVDKTGKETIIQKRNIKD